jgi:hypothetical protein
MVMVASGRDHVDGFRLFTFPRPSSLLLLSGFATFTTPHTILPNTPTMQEEQARPTRPTSPRPPVRNFSHPILRANSLSAPARPEAEEDVSVKSARSLSIGGARADGGEEGGEASLVSSRRSPFAIFHARLGYRGTAAVLVLGRQYIDPPVSERQQLRAARSCDELASSFGCLCSS